MRIIISRSFLLASLALFAALPACADTLDEALAKAYSTSPRLQARQAQLRAIDESVAEAWAGWKPTVNGSAHYEYEQQNYGGVETSVRPHGANVQLVQPLLRLQSFAAVQSAKRAVDAARASLVSQEQQLLFDAVSAYMNLLRDEAVLKLQQNNEQVLKRQLDAANDRFRVGEITRTDVSQAESRLAGATAERIQAEGTVQASRANYIRIIGDQPIDLRQPDKRVVLPTDLESAAGQAESANPDVVAAKFAFEQADKDVDTRLAQLLPEINLVGGASRAYDTTPLLRDNVDSLSIGVRATIPLYQGGAEYARTRAAKQTRSQRQLEYEETRRRAREAAVQAWQQYTAATAAIESRQAAVRANAIALDGTQQEAKVGTRTTLDVLNAEQEHLIAQVNLVRAEHDAVVASYQVLASVGQLTAEHLQLGATRYDPQAHYDDNAGKWIGIGD